MRRQSNYSFIFAADETAVWIDASNSLTIAEKGAKEVSFIKALALINLLGSSFDDRPRQDASDCNAYCSFRWFQMPSIRSIAS